MTEITKTEQDRREKLATLAHSLVRVAIFEGVRATGGQLIARPISGQADSGTMRDASPADGLVAARAIELQGRRKVRDYVRDARETGMGWHQIGELLNLGPDAEARGITIAEAAYDLTAGPADGYPRWFSWTCGTCGQLVSDQGPEYWVGDAERGHAEECQRLADTITAYDRGEF